MRETRAQRKLEALLAELRSRGSARLAPLARAHPSAPIAALDGTPYFARGPEAATLLIEGVYARHPERARALLRHRIFTNYAPAFAERELIKVAAKRSLAVAPSAEISPDETDDEELSPPDLPSPPPFPSEIRGADAAMAWALAEVRRLETEHPERRDRDRPIAAMLLSAEGAPLAAEFNTNSRHRTHHAELKILRRVGTIPPGATLVSTLRPCRMCAAAILAAAQDLASLRVLHAEDDPGPLGSNTALIPETPAWREACLEFPGLADLRDLGRKWDNRSQ